MLYLIVFATGFAGLLNVSWWAAAIGSCLLALYLMAADSDFEMSLGDASSWVTAQTASSLVIGAFAGPLAFAAGRFAAVTWGV